MLNTTYNGELVLAEECEVGVTVSRKYVLLKPVLIVGP